MKFTKNYISNINDNYESAKDCFDNILAVKPLGEKLKLMFIFAVAVIIVVPLVLLGLEPWE